MGSDREIRDIAPAITSMLGISHMVLIDFYFRLAPHIFFVLALALLVRHTRLLRMV